MPEARDRLSREEDVIAAYSRRRLPRTGERNGGRVSPMTFVLDDENEGGSTVGTPFRWRGMPLVGTPQPTGVPARRIAIGASRFERTPQITGRGNLPRQVGGGRGRGRGRARGRGRGSVLPSWYPRSPLNDITAVVRAIERRRELHRGGEGQQTEGPTLQDRTIHNSPASTSLEHPEHDISMTSPRPTISNKTCPPSIVKVQKILLDITLEKNGDLDCLTPQKKLLNNIDKVEKVVMEELRKLKRTPSAKKEEREKRVRTLMSMR